MSKAQTIVFSTNHAPKTGTEFLQAAAKVAAHAADRKANAKVLRNERTGLTQKPRVTDRNKKA